MKIIATGIYLTLLMLAASAQNLDEGKRQMYYERYATASHTFQSILQREPQNAEAVYHLTKALIHQDKNAEAGAILLKFQPIMLEHPFYKSAYGYWLLTQNKKDSATIYFSHAMDQTKKKDVGVLSAIADANINNENGDPSFAISVINDAMRRDKKNPALYVLLGDAFIKQNNGAAAYENYNKAVQFDQNYAAGWYKLGKIFLAQKSKDLYLDYFTKAVNADAAYAPAIYQLYAHYFYYNPSKAFDYYTQFAAVSDSSDQREYDLADILFLNKKYPEAIAQANKIMKEQEERVNPRVYKLMAYSLAAEKDTALALQNMQYYFTKEADSNLLAKDYELMAQLHSSAPDSSSAYLMKAVALEEDSSALAGYYKKLADLAKAVKNYKTQAAWLEKYYNSGAKTTNVDLFTWGLAHYLAGEYEKADSVFGMYSVKYPDQSFGYYWRARTNAAIDTEMKDGRAIPYYQKLVEVLEGNPTDVNYKKWMTEAYGYLAAYTANIQNNYPEAIGYFEKVLEVDATNENAKKYIEILEKDATKGN